MTASVYETLAERTKLVPNEGEGEQEYYLRLNKHVDGLSKEEFYELPEPVQNWIDDCITAAENKQPFPHCPGAPFANGEDTGGGTEAVQPKAKGGKKAAAAKPEKKAAAAPKGKGGKKTDAKAAKKAEKPKREAKPKTPKTERAPRETKIGVLHHLMEGIYTAPKSTAAELREAVASKHKVEVKPANAIGIHQQWRRWVKFLHSKGELKHITIE